MKRPHPTTTAILVASILTASVAHADDAPKTSSIEEAIAATNAAESSLADQVLSHALTKKGAADISAKAAALRNVREKLLDARDEVDRRAQANATLADLEAFEASQASLIADAKTQTDQALAIDATADFQQPKAAKTPPAAVAIVTAPPVTPAPEKPKPAPVKAATKPAAIVNPKHPGSITIPPEPLDVGALEAELAARNAAREEAAQREAATSRHEMDAAQSASTEAAIKRNALDAQLREAAKQERSRVVRREIGYGSLAGGAGAVLIGAIFYGVALSSHAAIANGSEATGSDIDSAASRTSAFSEAGVTFVVLGAIAAAAGGALVWTSKPPAHSVLVDSPPPPKSSATFAPHFDGLRVTW